LLAAWTAGEAGAGDRLLPLVYEELRTIAARHFRREPAAQTLQPTALVHEAWLRLVDQTRVEWRSRGHFYALASRAMRRILVDRARARAAEKRGGGARRIALDDLAAETPVEPIDLLALDEALDALTAAGEERVRVVELRYFGGLTIEETGEALEISPATVKRHWSFARAWLATRMDGGAAAR
jgi:RNA polymerase sigma factor (TIGR02999 family)